MKSAICSVAGAVGSGIAYALGGWDASIITLLIFMAVDYITGIVVAGVFHKSKKSESGALESRAGWKGLVKKCVTILFVIIAVRLDALINATYIRDAVCIAFITNELISIVENAGLMGIPIPAVITKAIDLLKSKETTTEE
jgi:toxin secretion/phage lysis holin